MVRLLMGMRLILVHQTDRCCAVTWSEATGKRIIEQHRNVRRNSKQSNDLQHACRMDGHVAQALDFMHANKHALLDRYVLLSASDRSFGSFGVVQIATVKNISVCASFIWS
jgi:hypothetical protein